MKTKKTIFAIPAAATAAPAKPKMAAMIATVKNANAHLNISPPEKMFCIFIKHSLGIGLELNHYGLQSLFLF